MPDSKDISLYIHIPFCLSKCSYCDFFSRPVGSCIGALESSYIRALENECAYCKETFQVDSWRTVYIGGGTPSLLGAESLKRLLNFLFSQGISSGAEVTVEANPESLTEEKLNVLSSCGVTRLSLGIQSMKQNALDAVGRHCRPEDSLRTLGLVKKLWKGDLSLDCIAGLPLQSDRDFADSLNHMLEFSPDHFSLYTLTVEEETPLYRQIEKGDIFFDGEDADRQWFLGRDMLLKNGYSQYEVSNFARPGHESRHNGGYWSQKSYAGAGVAACGTLYGKNSFRTQNCNSIEAYIDFWKEKHSLGEEIPHLVQEREELDLETLEREYLMMSLRTVTGADEAFYSQHYGSLEERLSPSKWWQTLLADGRAVIRGSVGSRFFSLTPDGLLLLNPLLQSLF